MAGPVTDQYTGTPIHVNNDGSINVDVVGGPGSGSHSSPPADNQNTADNADVIATLVVNNNGSGLVALRNVASTPDGDAGFYTIPVQIVGFNGTTFDKLRSTGNDSSAGGSAVSKGLLNVLGFNMLWNQAATQWARQGAAGGVTDGTGGAAIAASGLYAFRSDGSGVWDRLKETSGNLLTNDDFTGHQAQRLTLVGSADTTVTFTGTVRAVRVSNFDVANRVLVKSAAITGAGDTATAQVGEAPVANVPNVQWFPFKTASIHVFSSGASEVTVEGYS